MALALKKPFTLGGLKKPLTDFDYLANDIYDFTHNLMCEMKEIQEQGYYTSDYPSLARKNFHYLFTYGTLRKNFRNHKQLGRNPQLMGTGYSQFDRFFMATDTRNCFPIAFFDNRPETRAKIYGEIYKVSADDIRNLDYLESNGTMYKRHPLLFDVFQQDGSKQTVRAWVYLGVKDYWISKEERLALGRKVTPNDKSIQPYYVFTLADE